jgi:PAS domain S-box-containing protein
MAHILILSFSLLIQLIAVILALRLISITGRRFAWFALAAALGLMSVRRGISLHDVLTGVPRPDAALSAEVVALGISVLMLLAVVAIKPVFQAARRSDRIKNRFGRVVDSSLHEIYIFNADTLRFSEVNHGAQENLGYTIPELVNLTPLDLKPEFDDASFRKLLEPLLKGEIERARFSTRHRRKDGSEYPVEVDLQLARETDEPAFVAVIQDVSDRAKAEEALAERDAHYRALIENVQDVITEIDENGRIIYNSPSVERLLGYAPDERIGRNAMELVHPDDREHASEALQMILKGSEHGSLTYRVRHRDGSWRTVEAIGSGRWSADGVRRAVINQRDVTEREEKEAQLRQSQKLETIGTLAGGIAHDFANTLSPIIGYARMLKDELTAGKLRNYVDEILAAGDRARQLVRQILTFSRRSEQQRRHISFPVAVEEALRLVRFSLPATVELQTHIDLEAGTVLADETQIHQVMMNLCTNAHQAMQPDGGTLTVIVEREDVHMANSAAYGSLGVGSYVRLTVRDTGHGMDKNTLERVFEPFFTTRSATEGTGLGLSVAHGIVANHGGDMIARSEIGKGTSFHVWFPRVPDAPEEFDVNAAAPLLGGDQCILLVDDDHAVARVLSEMLSKMGYRVTTVFDPAEALARIRIAPGSFDLLITDQTMPGMTGLQLAAAARRLNEDMRIIVMSGYSEELDPARTEELGICSILSKPFEASQLDQEIRSVFDESRTPDARH